MLPLDHIPLYGDPEAMGAAFARLGFTLSPPSRYTTPEDPDAVWQGRCVFTRDGWLDLLGDSRARWPAAPMSLLFRTPDLATARRELADLSPERTFPLERRWAGDEGLPPERFAWFGLRTRIAPFTLAVIEHAWPCVDIRPEWQAHANGAEAVAAVIFGGEAPGPAAATAARFLDPTAIEYWPEDAFDAAFPGATVRRALRIRVADPAAAAAALTAGGARFVEAADGLAVPPQFGLSAGVLFST